MRELQIGAREITNTGSFRDFKSGQRDYKSVRDFKLEQRDFKSGQERFQIGSRITNRGKDYKSTQSNCD